MPPPHDYYLDKLAHMFAWVRRHHRALIDAPLAHWLDDFDLLPLSARRLLVRLIQRRGPCFRIDLLAYPEVADAPLAALALVLAGFARLEPCRGLRLAHLRVPELRALARDLGLPSHSGLNRPALLAALEQCEELPDARLPTLLRPTPGDELDYVRLLYFGSLRQDLTEFILADLGTLRWPRVTLSPVLPFADASQVRQALRVHQLADLVRALRQGDAATLPTADDALIDTLIDALADAVPCAHAEERRGRALQRLADVCEARGSARRSFRALRLADSPSARERACRLLARQGRRIAAEHLRRNMELAPRCTAEFRFAERFDVTAARCRPRRRRKGTIRFRRMLLPAPAPGVRVEQAVVDRLRSGGNRVLHMENRLPGMLFALGFWDIIFAPLPGAFVQPFQAGPTDLHAPQFRRRRAAVIDARLAAIREERFGVDAFMSVLLRERDQVNAFWGWQARELDAVPALLASIPASVRAGICDLVASEPGRARAGFPDLTLGNGVVGCYGFMEVKGPGDALRDGQRRWLEDLRDMGASAEVLEVRWA